MPLLRRQPFARQKSPPDLGPEDEVFFCRLTGEVFEDYEKFFERIILCNSLVWTCEITGKSGLTYQEAEECEEKALKQLASFPEYLQKPILYLATQTHRTRVNDMNDDVFTFAKDRYFIGETVDVVQGGEKKCCKVIQVIAPTPKQTTTALPSCNGSSVSDSDSDVICLDDPEPMHKKSPGKSPKSPKINCKEQKMPAGGSKPFESGKYQYVVQELRKSNIYIVEAKFVSRKKGLFSRDKAKLFLKQHSDNQGDGIWKVKQKFVKKFKLADANFVDFFEGPPPRFEISIAKKKPAVKNLSVIDLTDEDNALVKAKKEYKERKKEKKLREKEGGKKKKKKELMAMEAKPVKLTPEEKAALKEKLKIEKQAEKLAKKEEMKKFMEVERQKKKEERDKERMKKLEEKIERDRLLKEWSRPREDMECDDLKDMPVPMAIHSHVPSELVGDVLMILEYMLAFKTLFNLDDEFPEGITFEDLCKALVSTDTNGLYADIVRVLLLAVFNLQEEEDEEDDDIEDTKINEPMTDVLDIGSMSYKQLVNAATAAAQWPQLNLGAPIKKLHLDGFTMTEIVRLHFLSSGAKASENSCKFRFQQRGGYTSLDDPGLEFTKEEPAILKALQETNLFDLSAVDKLKIVTALINQLLTFVTSRDFIEDNFERLRQVKIDVRQLQSEEIKREREEAAFWYKKRMEERQKEREIEAEKKAQKKKDKEEKLRIEEGSEKKPIDIEDEKSNDTYDKTKEDDKNKEPERKSSRQIAKLVAKEDKEDLPVENIDWEKITPEERVRMKERFYKKEKELVQLIHELAHGNAICHLGRDRTFRRYWAFRAIPGLFVEDQEEHIPDDYLQPVEQSGSSNPFLKEKAALEDVTAVREEKSNSSDKENESFESPNSSHTNGASKDIAASVTAENKSNVSLSEISDNDVKREVSDTTKLVYESALQQIAKRNAVPWAYFSTPEQLDKLIDSLNPRGLREGALKQALQENKQWLAGSLEQCPVKMLSVLKSNGDGSNEAQAVNVKLKSRNKTTQGTVKNTSAQEFMELNLRESLLDIEERIFVGTLGSIKVSNRNTWRDAIEGGSYDQLCDSLQWAGKPSDYRSPSKQSFLNGENGMDVDEEEASPVVRDLSKALLQIAQSLEAKYIGQPLGDAVVPGKKKNTKQGTQKTKGSGKEKNKGKGRKDDSEPESDGEKEEVDDINAHKRPFERWCESLMSCTSLPQIFLHLTVLESSIVWAKSALHARCRLCRRKGDGEHMLLCDGCDRGHHMYCLKPQVKKIPQGDWFCTDCRPKEVPRTPRKRRKSFLEEDEDKEESQDEEDESDESDSENEDSDEEEEEEEEEESEENSDEESDDSDEESEEEKTPQPVKIRIVKGLRKQPASGRSTPSSETGRRGMKPSNSRASLENGRSAKGKASEKGGRQSLEPPKAKQGRKSLEPSRGRRSEEPEKPLKTGRRSLEPKGLRGSRSASSLVDMARTGGKRKADLIDSAPDSKRASTTSKSRGGESGQQMKLIEDLLNELSEKKEAWPFLTPVTKRDAPDYFDIVRKPMDFRTIRSKILKFEYLETAPIIEDIRLTFANCQQYNMQTAPEYQAGQKMARFFEKRLKDLKLDGLTKIKPLTNTSPSPKKKQRRN